MLTKARELMGDDFEKVSFAIGDVSTMPFSDSTIDLVICRHLIWTLPEPEKAIREFYRILKPGGRLGIIDGNWYLSYSRPTLRKLWVHVSHMFYKIRSGFDDSQKLALHYVKELPTTLLRRPDWDLGLLAGVGFCNLKTSTDLAARIWTNPLQRILRDLSYGMFLVEATKP
jgi:ubiquinone/menaquinone biosynthesis C-methylase UbiE